MLIEQTKNDILIGPGISRVFRTVRSNFIDPQHHASLKHERHGVKERFDRALRQYNVGKALIAVLAFDDSIWVTDIGTDAVLRVDPNDPTHPTPIAVGPRPWGIALAPGDSLLYTANGPSDDVSVVDVNAGKVLRRIPAGKSPWGVAIGP